MKKRPTAPTPSPRVPATLIRFIATEPGQSVRLAKRVFVALGEGGQVVTNADLMTSNLEFSKFITVTVGGRFNVYKASTQTAEFQRWIAGEIAALSD